MKIRILLVVIPLLALGAAGLWFAGPREPADPTIRFEASAIGEDPDAYLARTEADVANLRPDAAKEIVWAYPESRARTPLAIVYVHGFGGSKSETRPLADDVAKAMGANLYYARLTGHGQDRSALASARVNDWLNDLAEALAVGHAIGNEVVVVGHSTGGTLVAYAATRPELRDRMNAVVLLSPNFGAADSRAWMLDLPWARELMPYVENPTVDIDPRGDADNAVPTAALLPMAALVRAARGADYAAATLPALVFYAPNDRVVVSAKARELMTRWAGPHRLIEIADSGDPLQHILAGDARSPQTTAGIAERIVYWLRSLQL